MRITLYQLKEAFYAECNRASNLSLGRSFFQLSEITHFINAAYLACVNKRIGILDERFVPQDKRITQQQPTPIPSSMRVLLDFGSLYQNALLDSVEPTLNGYPLETSGDNSIIFHLAGMDQNYEPPYIVNATLVEFTGGTKKRCASYMCKPLTVTDAPRYSLMYQSNKYLPYCYYRVKPYREDGKTGAITNNMGIEVCTPDSANAKWEIGNFKLNCDMINFPTYFTEDEVAKGDAGSPFMAVMFGYEVAMEAARLAMESLGNARQNTLANMASMQMGQATKE